jgi:hypothetical protein
MFDNLPRAPDWFVKLVIFFFIIGVITVNVGIVSGIVWLCKHIRFV